MAGSRYPSADRQTRDCNLMEYVPRDGVRIWNKDSVKLKAGFLQVASGMHMWDKGGERWRGEVILQCGQDRGVVTGLTRLPTCVPSHLVENERAHLRRSVYLIQWLRAMD